MCKELQLTGLVVSSCLYVSMYKTKPVSLLKLCYLFPTAMKVSSEGKADSVQNFVPVRTFVGRMEGEMRELPI